MEWRTSWRGLPYRPGWRFPARLVDDVARGGAGRLEMDPGKGFAKIVKSDSVGGGVSTTGTESDTSGTSKGLAVSGQGDPEAAADVVGGAGTDDQGHRAVIVIEKSGVNGVERMLGVEDDFAQRAARAVGGGEKKFHGFSLRGELDSINRRI